MNILYINSGYPCPEVGGVERVTYDLGRWFVAHGYGVNCLVLCGEVPDEGSLPFPCVKLPEEGGWGTGRNLQAFREIQQKNQIDVIIVQSERAQTMELCSKAILPGVKLITVLHSSPVTQRGHFWDDCVIPQVMQYGLCRTIFRIPRLFASYCWNRRHEIQWERRKFQTMYSLSDKYVTLSESFHKELIRLGELQDNGSKLTSMANPLSMSRAKGENLKKGKILLWVGRLVFPQKKPDRILHIWGKVAKSYPNWKLCMVGDGEARPVLEDYCRKKHIENVVFAGRQPSEPWYQRAAILCVTSSWEGWGLVLTEAMNFGCVPIAYESYTSLRDIVTDGENGFCVPAFDEGEYIRKLTCLMDDADLRDRMAHNGQESVNRFRVDVVGQMWDELLKKIVS